MFSLPISDEVRDALLVNAYLMLKSYSKKKKVKASCCEGVIKTDFKETVLYGTNGILFEGKLETNKGDLTVLYLVRHQDLQEIEEAEHTAWLRTYEDKPRPSQLRSNPIRAVAKKHLEN